MVPGRSPGGGTDHGPDATPTAAVFGYLLAEHDDLVRTVLDCAEAVAAGWDGEGTTDRGDVVPPLRTALERAGVMGRLPAVLEDCVSAAGYELPARPVAAPPYVVVTSRGPILRATLSDGRLIVTIRTFEVERDPRPRYVRGPTDPEQAIEVQFDG